jgi:hypothetical protein
MFQQSKYKDEIVLQLSTACSLFVWFPSYAAKLNRQTLMINSNPWRGICRQLVFQPLFLIVFSIQKKVLPESYNATDLIASGCFAGACTGIPTNALEILILRKRLLTSSSTFITTHESILQSMAYIYHRSIMYGSLCMSLRNAGFAGVLFGIQPLLCSQLAHESNINSLQHQITSGIVCSVPSAILSSLITMPFDNIAVTQQLRVANNIQPFIRDSIVEIVKTMYGAGWRAFFVGTTLRFKQTTKEFVSLSIFIPLFSKLFYN